MFCITPLLTLSDDAKEYPFTLADVRREGQFNSVIYKEHDSDHGISSRWTLLMNNDERLALNIAAGDAVTIRSSSRECVG